MDPHEIVRVWGRADEYDLTFEHKHGSTWVFNGLPPDLEDGTYALQIWAENAAGAVGTRTGWLFLSKGVMCVQLDTEPEIAERVETDVAELDGVDIVEGICTICGYCH